MSARPVPHPGAVDEIAAAFTRFRDDIVAPRREAREFQSTSLEDVWKAVIEVEERLAAKQANRNLTRLRPLLEGLDHYCQPLEVLCNGTPYLPWIWAPIKFCVQVATENLDALDRLIRAYAQIGKALPRLDRLGSALHDSADFQQVLAVIYRDIVEFHRRAYQILHQNAWQRFFDSQWLRFERRYSKIIEDLQEHSRDVEREANAHGVAAVLRLRREALAEFDRAEAERTQRQFVEVKTWLDPAGDRHEVRLHDLLRTRQPGTCSWLTEHRTVRAWHADGTKAAKLWLWGIPGSGKSVLCAHLIETLLSSQHATVLYYLCDGGDQGRGHYDSFFRAIIAQAVVRWPRLASFVYDEYISKGVSLTPARLTQLCADVLRGCGQCYIVIDGLDECGPNDAKQIVQTLNTLLGKQSEAPQPKLAIFSRELPQVRAAIKARHQIALSSEQAAVDRAIRAFLHHEMARLREECQELQAPEHDFDVLEERIAQKAGGMFLWVRLVLWACAKACSIRELRTAIDSLPEGLQQAYRKCLQIVTRERYAKTIFQLVAFAKRPLRVFEVTDGVALAHELGTWEVDSKLVDAVVEQAKPLIEVSGDGLVRFIHFTVHEYLSDVKSGLDPESGPLLSELASNETLSLACATYFKFSLTLMDPRIAEVDRVEAVCAGLHGWHWYAMSHGWDHLQRLTRLRCNEQRPVSNDKLPVQLRAWSSGWNELYETERSEPLQRPTPVEKQRASENSNESPPSTEYEQTQTSDFSVHSRIQTAFTAIFHQILEHGSERRLPFLAPDRIQRFRSIYGSMAFLCRLSRCPRQTAGFSSREERDAHEASHRHIFTCEEPQCLHAKIQTFKTKSELAKHVRTWHSRNLAPVPEFLGQGFKPSISNDTKFSLDYTNADSADLLDNFDFDMFLNADETEPLWMNSNFDKILSEPFLDSSNGDGADILDTFDFDAWLDSPIEDSSNGNSADILANFDFDNFLNGTAIRKDPFGDAHDANEVQSTPSDQAETVFNIQSQPPMNSTQRPQSGNMLQQIHAKIMNDLRQNLASFGGGWQSTFDIRERAHRIMQLTTQLRFIGPDASKCLQIAQSYELRTIQHSPNREVYFEKILEKLNEITQHRHATSRTPPPPV